MDTGDGDGLSSLSETIAMHPIHTTTSTDDVRVNIAKYNQVFWPNND